MPLPNPRTGIGLSLICLGILGIMPIVTGSRPAGTDALYFGFLLSCWQAIFALPVCVRELRTGRKGIFGAPSRTRARVFGVSLLTSIMFGLSTWFYVLSLDRAGTVNASIAIQAYPLFAILTELVLLKQRKGPFETGVTLVMVLALYYLGTGGTWQVQGLSVWFLLALTVPLLWSIAHVLIRAELTQTPISPAQVTLFRVFLSSLFLGTVLACAGTVPAGLDPVLCFWAGIMGLLYYLELLIWFHAVRHIDISLASAVTAPWPVLTMALAAVVFKDQIQPYQLLAAGVIVACIYLLLAPGPVKGLFRQRGVNIQKW